MKFLHQSKEPVWEIESPGNMEVFLDTISVFDDSGKLIFMECTIWGEDFDIVRGLATSPRKEIPSGIISPPAESIHLELNSYTRSVLKKFLNKSGYTNLCSHFHIYDEEGILLEWFDTLDLTILVRRDVEEKVIKTLADRMKCRYSLTHIDS